MQIKNQNAITVYTSIRIPNSKHQMLLNSLKQQKVSFAAGGNVKQYSHIGRQFLRKLNTHFQYDSATVLHDIYPNEWKICIYTKY